MTKNIRYKLFEYICNNIPDNLAKLYIEYIKNIK